MEWQIIVALVVLVPVILLPVAFVWFLNFGGIYAARREAKKSREAQAQSAKQAR